jgi:hypothetical protein
MPDEPLKFGIPVSPERDASQRHEVADHPPPIIGNNPEISEYRHFHDCGFARRPQSKNVATGPNFSAKSALNPAPPELSQRRLRRAATLKHKGDGILFSREAPPAGAKQWSWKNSGRSSSPFQITPCRSFEVIHV